MTQPGAVAALRPCFREPIPEIFQAADTLQAAVEAHLAGDAARCRTLLVAADVPAILEWAGPFLGAAARNPYLWVRKVEGAPRLLPRAERVPLRMPTAAQKAELRRQHGYTCAFCRIPLIRAEVRRALRVAYPAEARWGRTNPECHAALLCMWLQYDHLIPHARGGDNALENIVLTCAPCNYGRMSWTLDEVGLLDPRQRPPATSSWDGLERFLRA